MKTQKQNTNLTKKQRLKNRKKQVRIQKLILASVCILLLGIAVLRPVYNHKQKNYTINSTCEGYRSKVETEAANYDMSDYVDLILALMMQESSGQGTDVMQSSEGAYNTKYPQSPNGITDIDYSISCGIQELKYALNKAGVTGPDDLDHIRLALQGYNFGADVYFNYLEKNGITSWSVESSEAFAKDRQRRDCTFRRKSTVYHRRTVGLRRPTLSRTRITLLSYLVPFSCQNYIFINFSNFFKKTFDKYNYIWYYMSC